jgi:hypothetical protein
MPGVPGGDAVMAVASAALASPSSAAISPKIREPEAQFAVISRRNCEPYSARIDGAKTVSWIAAQENGSGEIRLLELGRKRCEIVRLQASEQASLREQ